MKKYWITLICSLFIGLSFGQTSNESKQILESLKAIIKEDAGTFPRDMGNGQSWDKCDIVGNDYIFYYTVNNPLAVSSGMKMDEPTVKKIVLAIMISSDQATRNDFYSYVARAGLNLAYAYRFSSSSNYTIARFANKELIDFIEGKLEITPQEAIEAIAEQYKLNTPSQVEPGVILSKVEIKDGKFVMFFTVDNANMLGNLQANKALIRNNLKNVLESPTMSGISGLVASANLYLVYYYTCENINGSCIFAFPPEELREIIEPIGQ